MIAARLRDDSRTAGYPPKGQYGGGTVQIWDRATGNPLITKGGIQEGRPLNEFTLHGDKLPAPGCCPACATTARGEAAKHGWCSSIAPLIPTEGTAHKLGGGSDPPLGPDQAEQLAEGGRNKGPDRTPVP